MALFIYGLIKSWCRDICESRVRRGRNTASRAATQMAMCEWRTPGGIAEGPAMAGRQVAAVNRSNQNAQSSNRLGVFLYSEQGGTMSYSHRANPLLYLWGRTAVRPLADGRPGAPPRRLLSQQNRAAPPHMGRGAGPSTSSSFYIKSAH